MVIVPRLVTTIPNISFLNGPIAQSGLEHPTLMAIARAIGRLWVQIPLGSFGLLAQSGRASGFYFNRRNRNVVSSNLAWPTAVRQQKIKEVN
jgi:hypothetical protein